MQRIITEKMLDLFIQNLKENEMSEATIQKYFHDIKYFKSFLGNKKINKSIILSYKEKLKSKYAISSANSMLASLNSFFRFVGWTNYCIKRFKTQTKVFCSEKKELTRQEYVRLVKTAKQNGNERLNLIIQTICGTGIRVSELQFITVEAVRKGEAIVFCKNKTRTIFIVREL